MNEDRRPRREVVPLPSSPFYLQCKACRWTRDVVDRTEGIYFAGRHTLKTPHRCKVFLIKRWREGNEEIVDLFERRTISRKRPSSD